MRRTRHVALPVKAWQYIGLLIVSLACLTLGLVSRDKEGRAGSLAGPELEHQAPHQVDACPNSNFFTKMPYSSLDEDQTRVPKTSLTDSPRISRSRSPYRSSEARLQSRRDSKIERRLVDRDATDLSRLRSRSQESLRRSSDPIRLSRSSDLDTRLITRSLDRKTRSAERRSAVDRRENRDTLASRISERQERSGDRFVVRDRRSHSTERRESTLNHGMNRENRREVRDRRAKSLDRREQNFERHNQNRDLEDQRRSLINRVGRRAEDRRSLARDLHQVRTVFDDDRRNTRSVLDERRNSAAAMNLDSRSRTSERASSYSRINRQYSRSMDRQNSVSGLPERKLTKKSASMEERRERSALNSREQSTDLQTSGSRRERIDRSLSTTDSRNRLQLGIRQASKPDLDRRSTVRSERREASNERRERIARSDRRLESRSNERRETLSRSLEQSKVDNLERRERTGRVSRNRLARSSDSVARDLDRRVRDLSGDRRSHRVALLDSRRSAERQSNNGGNHQEIRTERSRINDLERRERLNRVNVDRQARESRERVARATERRVRDLSADRRSERRATVESRSLERRERQEIRNDRSRINNLERQEEPIRSMSARRVRTDLSRTPEASKRHVERRVRDMSADRRSERRATVESRSLERRERQEIRDDRSKINNLERREEPIRSMSARRVRTDLSRTPEASKRDVERRVRGMSADRRSERRATVESRSLERRERQEIRNDRSRINNLERQEEPIRSMSARRVRTDLSRTPEASKRHVERRVKDMSADRRSERRATVESRSLERRERQEIRDDRSKINNLERREEPIRSMSARRVRTDLSRTPEASKRDVERRVRGMSADRRSERRATVESRSVERREREERQEIRNDRSRINKLERREEPRRVMQAGRVRIDLSKTPDASKRVLERRVRDISADRQLERRAVVESRTLERKERQERQINRNDRSRINTLERREEPRRVMQAGRVRIDLSKTPDASKRVLERRVRDISADRQLERRAVVESRTLERKERQERQINRNDRSRINTLERREEPRQVMQAGRARTDLSRTPEASKRTLERRVRDLATDKRLERTATVESRTLERRERHEIRNDRSRINSMERVRDLSADRRSERRATVESRTLERRERQEIRNDRSRINTMERVRDLSADRRSERRATIESRSLDRRERQEIKNERSRVDNMERREGPRQLTLTRRVRSDLSRAPEASNRVLKRSVRDLSADRRSERRATVVFRSLEHRERQEIRSDRFKINSLERREESRRLTLAREARTDISRTPEASKRDLERRVRDSDQRSERRVIVRSRSSERDIRLDGRSERRALLDNARLSRFNSANRQEIRIDRRLSERSTLTLERRVKDLSAEQGSERRVLDAGRLTRSLVAVNRQDKLDQSLDSGRLLRQKMGVSRLQRSNDHANDIQRRQRLIATRRLLNDVRRSRLVDLSDFRGSRKDSMDSLRQHKSSRDHRMSDVDETRLKISTVLKERDSMKDNMTLEILRQAIVIGLCALYGLSIFSGKQSFISNLVKQSPRLILW